MENYAKRIYELRKREDISQEALALAIGTTRQQVSRWECGISVPTPKFAYALASYFKISVDELFGEKVESSHEDDKDLSSFRFRNIAIAISIAFLANFLLMALLGFFSSEIAKYLHIAIGEIRESLRNSNIDYDPATINVAIRQISESICLMGIVWTALFSFLIGGLFTYLFLRYVKKTKNKLTRSEICFSFLFSLIVALSAAIAGVMVLSVGRHVGFFGEYTLGLVDAALYLLGALFAADALVTLCKMVFRKVLSRFVVLNPWEGTRRVFDIVYVAMGIPLFIAFLALGTSSYVGFAIMGMIYFPISAVMLIAHILVNCLPLGKKD